MAQPQPQVPPRAFSPPQPSPSPAGSQSGFSLPPNKRPRTDGSPSQPASPYAASPYAVSPAATGTPPGTAGSPPFAQQPSGHSAQVQPYTNGHTSPNLSLPEPRSNASTPITTPQPLSGSAQQFTTATMAPVLNAQNSPAQPPGSMGPPQRPADRPVKDYEYDVTDSLAGTGIDLRAEEQFMSDLYSNGLESNSEARTGFAHQSTGPKSSFYGAGPANQPAQDATEEDQKKAEAQAAQRAWAESSTRLAVQRTQEINDPFLMVAMLHRRADKIAKEHHLGLNLDMRNNSQTMGKMRLPEQFPSPQVTVRTIPGPDSTIIHTTGSYIPHDAYLVDQLALLSIAAKQRLRELVEDANVVANNRQKTSHGEVPDEWAPAAAPMNREILDPPPETGNGAEPESAWTHGTNPLKRPADVAEATSVSTPAKLPKISSYMTATMREMAKREREWEEARLRKRQKRKDGTAGAASTPSRPGSVAPGTPGSVAPEEKNMTKKELKKNQALKAAEANSHANQNMTSSMFAGLGGKGGLFGKKKTGKTYDWMNVGRGGSGTSTPTRGTPGTGKGSGGTGGSASPGAMSLTTEGRNRLGTWREDKEKGKHIQLRDWVAVLERDGREPRALQHAYIHLDTATPR